jgi:hypothetical protein
MTLTSSYGLEALNIGEYVVVYEHFQHARVAASEHARKHGKAFSCRKQSNGTMHVYRVAANQANVDRRGSRSKRYIPYPVPMPTKDDFMSWLGTMAVGQSQVMLKEYEGMYPVMQAWCELYSLKTGHMINTYMDNGLLVITYVL